MICKWCNQERDTYKLGFCETCYKEIRGIVKSSKEELDALIIESKTASPERKAAIGEKATKIANTLYAYLEKKGPVVKEEFEPKLREIHATCGTGFHKKGFRKEVFIPWAFAVIFFIATAYLMVTCVSYDQELKALYASYQNQYELITKMSSQLQEYENAESNAPAQRTVVLENGNFVSGKDFTAGTYDITALKGMGNVYSDNSYDGGINAIMGSKYDDPDGFSERKYTGIYLPEGTTLTVDGVKIQLQWVD